MKVFFFSSESNPDPTIFASDKIFLIEEMKLTLTLFLIFMIILDEIYGDLTPEEKLARRRERRRQRKV